MAEDKDVKLFAEFAPVTTAEWDAVINVDLKGADYDKKLVWKPLEGFSVRPYYRAEDLKKLNHLQYLPGQFPYVRSNNTNSNAWLVRQEILVEDVKAANAKALDVLMKGVDSLGFVFNSCKELTAAELDTLLEGICVSAIEVNFVCCCKSRNLAKLFIEKMKKAGVNLADVRGSINYSPLSSLSLNGEWCSDEAAAFANTKEMIEAAATLPNFKVLSVDGSIFHNSGATSVQELAFALSMGNEYLAKLTDLGACATMVTKAIRFNFSVSSNYFMEIAKFRAARMLWAEIVKSYGVAENDAKMSIHAETSKWNQTIYDPYVNMLRGTTEAMSATIAGVDSLTVVPFDAAYRQPTEFSDRIARNAQLLLKEEAHFDLVVDPSAGSYYIETLTDSIAKAAWELFKQAEEKGGYVAAFTAGFVQETIKATAQKRDMNIATRRDILLGTNQYPNFTEVAEAEVTLEAITRAEAKKGAVAESLAPYRGAMAFEALRFKTDKSGKEPKAFMLTIGALAMRRARAQFACNFFACAGLRTIDHNGYASVEEGVKAALEAKADVVVICSSDDEYTTYAPEAYEMLKGKAIFVVAGAPACEEELKAKGITNFISVKSNVLETLKGYQAELGI
ncbi:methylmalonyl-CoA mutase family protein [Acetobacteroides hydrogenigenes]|uniref:Methylmalonyl-CoA mutase n=1 Tax=Acetobacteroides hydrogenigenes TaxID=979970 RepID=A0A4R2EVX1_9BACT|nr:methylmalonyl-CoA mutase family protein [Acetobacteroides hydrogenigenes]TCN73324.1 methylmalonyl-CoA mutase [Acetobacteroides hydrogenigenes]